MYKCTSYRHWQKPFWFVIIAHTVNHDGRNGQSRLSVDYMAMVRVAALSEVFYVCLLVIASAHPTVWPQHVTSSNCGATVGSMNGPACDIWWISVVRWEHAIVAAITNCVLLYTLSVVVTYHSAWCSHCPLFHCSVECLPAVCLYHDGCHWLNFEPWQLCRTAASQTATLASLLTNGLKWATTIRMMSFCAWNSSKTSCIQNDTA